MIEKVLYNRKTPLYIENSLQEREIPQGVFYEMIINIIETELKQNVNIESV